MYQAIHTELALNALLMAVWRRNPKESVVVHSDQGCRYSSHDNAVAESFFELLKRERIRRKIYANREDARRDIFDCFEMFYNAKRRHGYANDVSPVQYEKQYFNWLESVYCKPSASGGIFLGSLGFIDDTSRSAQMPGPSSVAAPA